MVTNLIKRSEAETALWCRRFEDLCRARRVRVTTQRLAVYRALAQDLTHPTADAVHARLRSSMSSLSPATVYRIIEFLEREGLVRRVSTTEGAGRYDANLAQHQHLVCRLCGDISDFGEGLPLPLRLPRSGMGGFVAEEYDVRITGMCGSCRSAHRPSGAKDLPAGRPAPSTKE